MKAIFRRAKDFIATHKLYVVFGGLLSVVLIWYMVAFLLPRTVAYSYGNATCVDKVMIAPGVQEVSAEGGYEVEFRGGVNLGEVQLVSTSLCFSPTTAPEEGVTKVQVAPWGGVIARTTFRLEVPEPPVASIAPLEGPLPASRPVTLPLSKPDETFTYALAVEQEEVECQSEDTAVVCNIEELALKQGASYKSTLTRAFEDQSPEVLHQGALQTLDPLRVKKASVRNNQTIYTVPKTFTIETDKPLVSASVSLVRERGDDKESVTVPVETSMEGNNLEISIEDELPRQNSYRLVLEELVATDESVLEEPYEVSFRTSDGPRFVRASLGATRAPSAGSVTLTFDQPLSATQDIAKLVGVSGATARVQRGESTITVNYSGAQRCAPIVVTVGKGLLSKHDVRQDNPVTFRTRTTCHTVESIGTSSQGRPIYSYVFGGGSKTYLFSGAIHGNELSSRTTMERFIDDLEAQPGRIPAGVRIVVVPVANPDGALVGARNNARGVNLNRNFPTSNWTANTEVSNGRVEKGAGGSAAGSEPETKALMSLTQRYAPRLVVTHHAQGSLVNSNDVGVALSAGRTYARLARYWFIPNSQTTATFGFVMTGTYESWLLERGTPAILIELDTHTGHHYARNSAAMWAMLGQ